MNLLDNISSTFDDALAIIKPKNQDYATAADPFHNLRSSELVGVSVERAILVRVLDKISRISNLIDRPPAVVNESLEDAVLDAINYLALLKAKREMEPK